jgi:hypothetical protein
MAAETKALSKAARLRLKRSKAGRPRKKGVERFPSGKVKPLETEKETKSVAIEARRRIHGKDINAESPFAGYVLGRLFLDGQITEEQREAGDEYAEIMMRYYRAVGVPFPSARAQDLFSVRGHDGEVTESIADRARKASNKMMEMMRILLSCDDGPQVRQTVHNVCVMDYDHLRGMPQQQVLWLRRGLSAINANKLLHERGKSDNSTVIPI